jgi:hypothetical protein
LTKNVFGYFLGDFSQTRLVTLAESCVDHLFPTNQTNGSLLRSAPEFIRQEKKHFFKVIEY